MRVLGVDPGLTRCGLGVVEGTAGRPLTMRAAGVVRTPSDVAVPERLVLIEQGIEEWLERHEPEAVAVERVFSQHNVRTVMGTAQAAAVAMLCAARRGLPVEMHTPSEVKAAVTGTGRADKQQIGTMMMRLLRLDAPPRPADAADALALAVCHIWRVPAQQRLKQLQQQAHTGQSALARAQARSQAQEFAKRSAPSRAAKGTQAPNGSTGPRGSTAPEGTAAPKGTAR
ncbi:crossover junction endodeoxyribonuclease RuvC [Streptomyces marispadix]|uniref:Crossover junction endodeoxyribonuclease RuvC n=1 Tax=Streptomyces marispadix TaxID=2922868 RepID=A0ABS9SSD5_9ACTN|nr:crossover junction endodeoxyribonuclease RuvC [Streptomyces marispadix]MCH6159200.1 crossover junction endodeoxyribonuclease RuvC [Streptomyces marispadix]